MLRRWLSGKDRQFVRKGSREFQWEIHDNLSWSRSKSLNYGESKPPEVEQLHV